MTPEWCIMINKNPCFIQISLAVVLFNLMCFSTTGSHARYHIIFSRLFSYMEAPNGCARVSDFPCFWWPWLLWDIIATSFIRPLCLGVPDVLLTIRLASSRCWRKILSKCCFCYMPRAHFNRMACHCGWLVILTTGLRCDWLSLFVKLLGLSVSLLFHFDSGRRSLWIAHSEGVGRPATQPQLWGGDRNFRRKELHEVFRSPECGLEWDCGTTGPVLSPWFCSSWMSGSAFPPCCHDALTICRRLHSKDHPFF